MVIINVIAVFCVFQVVNSQREFGKVLVVGGSGGNPWGPFFNNVSLIDLEKNTSCQLKPLPVKLMWTSGDLINTANGPRPLVCGDMPDPSNSVNCYLLASNGWEEVHSFSKNQSFNMAGVAINPDWIFFSGHNGGSHQVHNKSSSFLLNSQGEQVSVPDVEVARGTTCATIIHSDEQSTQVAVLGGHTEGRSNLGEAIGSMERYRCSKGETPVCTRDNDGPAMNQARSSFGCGTLQTSQGGRVLLALKNWHGPQTEILDLTTEGSTWKTLPANMDVERGARGEGSFVTSNTDPSTGYFMPPGKQIYRVKCATSTSCKFDKITTGYNMPDSPVTMVIQNNSGLSCA